MERRIDELADDYDISSHKAGLRAMDRGLQVLGYDEIGEEETQVGRVSGRAGSYLALAGIVLAIAMGLPAALLQVMAAVSLAMALAALFVERAEPTISNKLGVPKETQHPEVAADGGGKE